MSGGLDAIFLCLICDKGLETLRHTVTFGASRRGGDRVDHINIDDFGVVCLCGLTGEIQRLGEIVSVVQINGH